MSLFPAYAPDSTKGLGEGEKESHVFVGAPAALPPEPLNDVEESTSGSEGARESALLASDEEEAVAEQPQAVAPSTDCFYCDTRMDCGNLRVSTLYYPGRPEYHARKETRALGGARRAARRGPPRYWQARRAAGEGPAGEGPAAAPAERAAALRAALAERPADECLWLRYVAFQEEWGSGAAAVEAAGEAAARAGSERVRAALHRLRARHLPAERALGALHAELAAERRAAVRAELWARVLEAAGAARAGPAARAALAALGAGPEYVRALYAHGCVLRAAGLWERLVLTVELAAAINFPPAPAFPPAPDAAADRRREDTAARLEDEACRSGLPLSAVWARVERVRAAAHWRASAHGADADPQRAPEPAAAAELLRGVRGERAQAALAAALLRLAKVPLLPASERLARAAGPEARAGEPALAEALAGLLRAGRRLPRAHAAAARSPGAARAALAPLLDPPHYFSDDAGYLRWCCALWEACCAWTHGARRLALVCWRLRWLHALALLAEPPAARRLRHDARAALKRLAPAEPLAYAHFARLEAAAAGADAGRRAARHALRAALRESAAAPEHALFAARVLGELDAGPAARWAACCAVLRREPPPDERMQAEPPHELRAEALRCAADRCARLEAGAGQEEEEEEECAAMLPGPGEWAAARAALAPPAERARLLAALLAGPPRPEPAGGYREAAACALALAATGSARRAAARELLPRFPRNALLALMCSGAGPWAGGEADWAAESERATLASLLPLLLRAPLAADADPAEAARVSRRCAAAMRRAAGAGGSALVAALRVEAGGAGTERALLAALADYPDHKWLYVRGAAWCGAEAGALPDALLERGLRLHALPEELHAPPDKRAPLPDDGSASTDT